MEGMLHKWTNMFNGWQPRWFILENGVLSYYKSQEEVSLGSKGSLKMTVCDVNVHANDRTRLDLVIPGEQHFYIKAATAQERQQWLVALGSAKACINNGTITHTNTEFTPEVIRSKKSELRLYCDLLMQQVGDVRHAINENNIPNVQQLEEATTLLRATCETFIITLESCMQVANSHLSPDRPHSIQSTHSPLKQQTLKSAMNRTLSGDSRHVINPIAHPNVQRSYSESETINNNISKLNINIPKVSPSRNHVTTNTTSHLNDLSPVRDEPPEPQPVEVIDDAQSADQDIYEDAIEPSPDPSDSNIHIDNFFSLLPTKFGDVVVAEESQIPTDVFLEACRCLSSLFDYLDSTAFAPVKMDVTGNIRKIHQKYLTNPVDFAHIQKIVMYELCNKQNISTNSATSALLWLKRSLEFLLEFIDNFFKSRDDLSSIITSAYSVTLKPYHSWVVRGVYALAVKSLPDKDNFISSLCGNPENSMHPQFIPSLTRDIKDYVGQMREVMNILREFYTEHHLDLDDQV